MNLLDFTGQLLPDFIDGDLLAFMLIGVAGLTFLLLVVFPMLETQERFKKRTLAIGMRSPGVAAQEPRSAAELQKRRKNIAESLQEVASRNEKKKRANLDVRIAQAGLNITPTLFVSIAIIFGALVGFMFFWITEQTLLAAGVTITLVYGVPNWLLNYLRNRRIDKFILNFPSALETIVRGVRSGLPLNDCLTTIASEAQEPIRSEFRMLIENLTIGLTLGEAAERMAERIPTPETMFFSIVLGIQSQTGGNIGETLENLSNVLRDRKKLREKVGALSSEAKASAGIIGSLPIFVLCAVYYSTPGYLTVLFTTSAGKLVLGGGLLWMLIGIFIMKQMINFDI